jgi:hypothetical protein
MSLHVAATIHCSLGSHADAIPILERVVEMFLFAFDLIFFLPLFLLFAASGVEWR